MERKINPRLNIFNKYKTMGNIINPYIFAPTIPRTNLLAEYLFNDNSLDTSGNGYNGTNFGTFSYATVLGKKCVSFTGLANSYIRSNLNKTVFGTAFTISVWVLANNTTDAPKGVYSFADFPTASSPWLILQQNSSSIKYYYSQGFKQSNTFASNVWNHYVLTFDGAKWTSYFNKVATSLTQPIGTQPAPYLFIGSGYGGTFNGCIAKFRAYNRVLTVDEIAQLYNEA